MPGLGNHYQLGKIQSSSFPVSNLSGCGARFFVFQGFSLPAESREVYVNRQRISVFRHAASVIVASASGSLVFSDSSCSRELPLHAVSPASAPSLVGSGRRLHPSSVGRLFPSGSEVVTGAASSGVRDLSNSCIPRPRLMVRRVRHRLGRSLGGRGRFRPLVSKGVEPLHQCQGALGSGEGSAPVWSSSVWIHSGRVSRLFHGRGVST